MRVYQLVVTVLDFDGLGVGGVVEELENGKFGNDSISPKVRSIKSAEIGEWDDNHPLNKRETEEAELTRLFG